MCPAVVSGLEGKDCREVMKSIAESSTVPQERLGHVVSGVYRVLSEAVRVPASSLKQEVSRCPLSFGVTFILAALDGWIAPC